MERKLDGYLVDHFSSEKKMHFFHILVTTNYCKIPLNHHEEVKVALKWQ